MSENEFPAVPQPVPQTEAEAVASFPMLGEHNPPPKKVSKAVRNLGIKLSTAPLPNGTKPIFADRLDEVSTAWRKKVAQGFYLSLIMGLLWPVWSGLVAWLAEGMMGKIIFYSWFCAGIPIGIYTLWLITTALPKSFGYMSWFGKLNRYLVTGAMLISPALIALLSLLPDQAKNQSWLLFTIFLVPQVIMLISGVVGAWYLQKLAQLANVGPARRTFTFLKWSSAICFSFVLVMLFAEPEITESMATNEMEKSFFPDYAKVRQFWQNEYVFWFMSVMCAYFSYLNWRLYRRIRVPAGLVEAEQFAGDMNDEQGFGD